MPVRQYKPTSPGRRLSSVADFSELTKKEPEKSLIVIKKRTGGRNAQGKITTRHRGGGAKRFLRVIDFKRDKYDIPGRVIALEYDPNRSARLALVEYEDGDKRYILQGDGLKVGDTVLSSKQKIEAKISNSMPLGYIPPGSFVHNIEIVPGGGGKMVRSAGCGAQFIGVEGKYAHLKMPSSEVRMVLKECSASVGLTGNVDHWLVRLGKAGRKRWLGRRPEVRGKAMNPVDHPHGGGEGRSPIGLVHPKTPWGKPALGVKTRKRQLSNKFIISRKKHK
jgi:large subunit ribosomal protein L2